MCAKLLHAVAIKTPDLLPADPVLQARAHFCTDVLTYENACIKQAAAQICNCKLLPTQAAHFWRAGESTVHTCKDHHGIMRNSLPDSLATQPVVGPHNHHHQLDLETLRALEICSMC